MSSKLQKASIPFAAPKSDGTQHAAHVSTCTKEFLSPLHMHRAEHDVPDLDGLQPPGALQMPSEPDHRRLPVVC